MPNASGSNELYYDEEFGVYVDDEGNQYLDDEGKEPAGD